jgi:hypothetical protein
VADAEPVADAAAGSREPLAVAEADADAVGAPHATDAVADAEPVADAAAGSKEPLAVAEADADAVGAPHAADAVADAEPVADAAAGSREPLAVAEADAEPLIAVADVEPVADAVAETEAVAEELAVADGVYSVQVKSNLPSKFVQEPTSAASGNPPGSSDCAHVFASNMSTAMPPLPLSYAAKKPLVVLRGGGCSVHLVEVAVSVKKASPSGVPAPHTGSYALTIAVITSSTPGKGANTGWSISMSTAAIQSERP